MRTLIASLCRMIPGIRKPWINRRLRKPLWSLITDKPFVLLNAPDGPRTPPKGPVDLLTSLVNYYIWIVNLELPRGMLWAFLGIRWTQSMPSFSMGHHFKPYPFQFCHPWWVRVTVPRGTEGIFFLDDSPASYCHTEPHWVIKGSKSWEKLQYSRRMQLLCDGLDFSAFSYKLQVFKTLPLAVLLPWYFPFSIYFSSSHICMRVVDNVTWNFHFLKPFSTLNCTLYVLRPRLLNEQIDVKNDIVHLLLNIKKDRFSR